MPNRFINKWGTALTRIVGLTAFIWQIIQFFYSKWAYEWYVEVFILLLFFMIARYPNRVVELFNNIGNKFTNKTNSQLTGGDGTDEDGEV